MKDVVKKHQTAATKVDPEVKSPLFIDGPLLFVTDSLPWKPTGLPPP